MLGNFTRHPTRHVHVRLFVVAMKSGHNSRKELVTPIHIPLYDGRHFGSFQVNWTSRMINGQTLKKELSSIFRSPIHILPSISLSFSFSHPSACLSYVCPRTHVIIGKQQRIKISRER